MIDIKSEMQSAFAALKRLHELNMEQFKKSNTPREIYEVYWEDYKILDTALINVCEATDVNPFPLP